MLDTAGIWRIDASVAPDTGQLLVGKTVDEARELVGRMYHASRGSAIAAFDIASGGTAEMDAIATEIRRDHIRQIFLAWPKALGLRTEFTPEALTNDRAAMRALFGATARAPRSDFEMAGFLGSDNGVGPMLRLIGEVFEPGMASAETIPFVNAETVFRVIPAENSGAVRQAATPALAYVEAMYGRGPLWRAAGRVLDLAAILAGQGPRSIMAPQGSAIVPATRGHLAVSVVISDGSVSSFSCVTPTDHALAPGGALEMMLASLPPDRAMLMPILMALVDPCRPVSVEVMGDDRGVPGR